MTKKIVLILLSASLLFGSIVSCFAQEELSVAQQFGQAGHNFITAAGHTAHGTYALTKALIAALPSLETVSSKLLAASIWTEKETRVLAEHKGILALILGLAGYIAYDKGLLSWPIRKLQNRAPAMPTAAQVMAYLQQQGQISNYFGNANRR